MAETEPYDLNFCFPVRVLENDKVKLTPFIPSLHIDAYWAATHDHPEIYGHLPSGPFASNAELVSLIETRVRSNPAVIVYAVLDKLKSDESSPPLAGLIGLLNVSASNLSAELGWLITFPAYQRTHVTTNAIGLLLTWCLDLPSQGGLGLRRVQYQAHTENAASRRKAEKMGFKFEMVQRWQRVVPDKPGEWSSAVYSMCWDDWVEWRGKVLAMMERKY